MLRVLDSGAHRLCGLLPVQTRSASAADIAKRAPDSTARAQAGERITALDIALKIGDGRKKIQQMLIGAPLCPLLPSPRALRHAQYTVIRSNSRHKNRCHAELRHSRASLRPWDSSHVEMRRARCCEPNFRQPCLPCRRATDAGGLKFAELPKEEPKADKAAAADAKNKEEPQ